MSKNVGIKQAAGLIKDHDNILILTHKNPDGDTLGSGFALCAAIRATGKKANVQASGVARHYSYMTELMSDVEFEPEYVVSVDVASENLIDDRYKHLRVDVAIDHHGSNSGFADNLLCDPESASCAEIVADIIAELGVKIDKYIAECLYTGVSTDTGCFRYSNTTSSSLRLAAEFIDIGIDYAGLNRVLFEVKSRGRIKLETAAFAGMEFTLGGKIAIMTITDDMLIAAGVDIAEVEGITAIPRNVEGVEAGVTLRELENGTFKVSLRTLNIDAAKICSRFGGGGHRRAAGFECSGTQFDVKAALVAEIEKEMN